MRFRTSVVSILEWLRPFLEIDVQPSSGHHARSIFKGGATLIKHAPYRLGPVLTGLATVVMLMVAVPQAARGQPQDRPWMDPALDADTRARLLLGAMTREEKLALVFGYYSSDAPWKNFRKPKEGPEQA